MKSMIGLMLASLLAAPLAAQPAHEVAEDAARTVPGAASKGVRACHDDIEKLCAAVKPGGGRLGRCLKKNSKKLSAPCRDWLSHGGQGHVDKAFQELDASTAPAKSAPTKK